MVEEKEVSSVLTCIALANGCTNGEPKRGYFNAAFKQTDSELANGLGLTLVAVTLWMAVSQPVLASQGGTAHEPSAQSESAQFNVNWTTLGKNGYPTPHL
jgi:hypothetical protein